MTPIFELCTLAYEDMAKEMKKEIEESMGGREVFLDPRNKFQQEKIMVESGKGLR